MISVCLVIIGLAADLVRLGLPIPTLKSKEDIFKVNFITTMLIKWPGPLLYLYQSKLGKTISPVSVAFFIEVSNNKTIISRIYSYKARALLKYDEGGLTHITRASDGGIKYEYKPSGKTVEKWRTLHSMGFLGDQAYFVINNDWSKCKRIDFTKILHRTHFFY